MRGNPEAERSRVCEPAARYGGERGEIVLRRAEDGSLSLDVRLSRETLHQMNEEALLSSFREQLIAPDEFLAAAGHLRGTLEESLDILRFKDGRVLRCSSRPLPEGGLVAGRVWVVSDITARTHGERERRERNPRLERQSEARLRLRGLASLSTSSTQ